LRNAEELHPPRRIWQKSNELSYQVFWLTRSLPRSEDYGLTSQIRRAASAAADEIPIKTSGIFILLPVALPSKPKAIYYMETKSVTFPKGSQWGDSILTNKLINEYQDLIHQLNKILKTLKPQPQP